MQLRSLTSEEARSGGQPGDDDRCAFQHKWRGMTLKERSASQSHFNDLCHMLGVPTPTDADPTGSFYTFERGAEKTSGGAGWARCLVSRPLR